MSKKYNCKSHHIESHIENNELIIDMIFVKKSDRKKGIASKMLDQFLYKNSNTDIPIVLHACPQDDNISQSDLIKFYEYFGFINDGYGNMTYN